MSNRRERFFYMDMKPFTHCLGFSLKSAVMVIAVIDFFFGFFNLWRFIYQSGTVYMGGQSIEEYVLCVSYFIGSLSIIFAFNCWKAIMILKYEYLYEYSVYKQVEFVIQFTIAIWYEALYYSRGIYSHLTLAFLLVTRLMLYYLAKIVWSTFKLIKSGDTYLVIEGTIKF